MKHFKHIIFFILTAFTISAKSQIITTVAGNGIGGYSGDGGIATAASINFNGPAAAFAGSIYVDASNNIFISDSSYRIRRVNGSTGIITTIAGTGVSGFSGDGGMATSAQISAPLGIYKDASGNVYFWDDGNARIRKINTSGIISTFAGNGTLGYSGDGGLATLAELVDVTVITGDSLGNIYVADYDNEAIRKIDNKGVITTIAGNATGVGNGDGGPAIDATIFNPYSISFDASGNYYIATSEIPNSIRKVNTSNIISTIAGSNSGDGNSGDGGPATSALFCRITNAVSDAAGNIYIADACNNEVRKVNAATGIITRIAGTGTAGYSGNGGAATSAKLNSPYCLSIANGDLYIEDKNNFVIRKVSNIVLPLNLLTFTGQLQNNNVILNWQTANEVNTAYFNIERCADGINFSQIGTINASVNTSSAKNYSYTDQQTLHGTGFYRLKMVDIDGKFTYSKIVAIKIDSKNNTLLIFPNPAKDVLYVQANGVNEMATIQIVDATGRKLKEEKITLNGNTSFSIDINNLSKGIYSLLLKSKSINEQKKFVKE